MPRNDHPESIDCLLGVHALITPTLTKVTVHDCQMSVDAVQYHSWVQPPDDDMINVLSDGTFGL
jgi:hypothetical protein